MIFNLLNMACQLLTNLKKVLHRRRDGNSDPSAILSFFCTAETLLIFRLGATSSQIKTGATHGYAGGTYNCDFTPIKITVQCYLLMFTFLIGFHIIV